jgi:hypothetical protein
MKALSAIGTIAHSCKPGVRVTLYEGDDGFVWAAAPGEDVYKTDTPIGREASAWHGREWDYQPAKGGAE